MLKLIRYRPSWQTIIIASITILFLAWRTYLVYWEEQPNRFVGFYWEDVVIDPKVLGNAMKQLFIPIVGVLLLGNTSFFDRFVTRRRTNRIVYIQLTIFLFGILLLNLFFTVWQKGTDWAAVTDGLLVVLIGALLMGWVLGFMLGFSAILFYAIYDSIISQITINSLATFLELFFGTFYDLSFVALLCSGVMVGLIRNEAGLSVLHPFPLFVIGFTFEWLPSWLNAFAFGVGDVVLDIFPGALMTGLTLMVLGLFAQRTRGRVTVNQLAQIEKMQVEAEMKALRAQINPHFLFNALSTIQYHARTQPEIAYSLLDNLADIFHAALRAESFIPLEEEFATVESYLLLEQARLRERLAVEWHIAPDINLQQLVPSLIIQPFVENSIVHGIAPQPEGGTLVISAKSDGSHYWIEISDDGVGFDPSNPSVKGHGIGQANVSQRLQNLYGEAFVPVITSQVGQGTQVTVRIPYDVSFS
ncbi:MAG: histidine kinase [Chloroflexota bacterium]